MVNKKEFDELKELINSRFDEQCKAIEALNKKYDDLLEDNRKMRVEHEDRITMLEAQLQEEKGRRRSAEGRVEVEEKLSTTNAELLKVDAYQRRENLRFHGLVNLSNPEESVRTFLENDLKMGSDFVKNIEFQRIHKVGKPMMGPTDTRPIIARFVRFTDVEKIKEAAMKKPKGSPGGVQDDLPAPWAQTRKALHDQFIKPAKQAKIKLKIKWFQDKLTLNGHAVHLGNTWSEVKSKIEA